MNNCNNCKKEIDDFTIAINRSLLGKENIESICLECLSKELNCKVEDLIKYGNNKIKEHCALFDGINK